VTDKGRRGGLLGRLFGRDNESTPPPPRQEEQLVPAGNFDPEQAELPSEPAGPPDTASDRASSPAPAVGSAEPKPRDGWLARLKAGLAKSSSKLSENISGVFTKRKLDPDKLEELEDVLIRADLGVETAMRVTEALARGRYDKGISAENVRGVLAQEIERILLPVAKPLELDSGARPHVILVVGVNGTGKTTTIGKLAARFIREGRKVMLAAGDTFRAAAIDQLKVWGERTGATVIARAVGADAAGLAYEALQTAQAQHYDVLLIDTAGRLQNKQALMDELEKVTRVLKKLDPQAPQDVLLVLDATTGQNALDQVQVFKERAGVTGLIMTKLDGSARGGILVAIAARFGLPVHAVGVGESIEDLEAFEAGDFARAIALS
jgi:fused signal recognition particle receptor